jgi:hypothetical protein
MNTFKEFFKANHDYSILMEMAYREHVVKRPVSIDNEDIDFLYQVDQKDWPMALKTRYDVLYKLLENRDKVRDNIKKELFKEMEKSFGRKKLAVIREIDFKDKFKKLVLDFAANYNDYGDSGTGEFNIIKLTNWLNNDLNDYDLESKMKEIGYRHSDVRNAFKDFVYYIVDAIVPFVKEEKEEFKGSFINFYINRLIQKLETTRGKDYIIPNNSPYSPTNLPNIKSVLPKEVSNKIKLTSLGEYGFDLSGVKKTSKSGKQRVGSKSFAFPSETNIDQTVRRLLTLNFHRHLGPLLSDETPSSFDDLSKDGKFRYKIIRTNDKSKNTPHDQKPKQKDNHILQQKKNGIKNDISRILSKAQSGDYKNWEDPKLTELWDIIGKSSEATDGAWFDNAGLNKDEELKSIFGSNKIALDARGKKEEEPAWEVAKREKWFSELKTPLGGGVAGNSKLKRKFSEYFAEKTALRILSSSKQLSPQILSDKETDEFSEEGHPKIDKEELDQIKKSLTPEQFETFKKTGRLPYSLKQDGKKPEIIIGNPEIAQSAFLMLPTVKHTVDITDKDGNKVGEKTIHLPVINGSRFIRDTPSKLKDSEDEEDKDMDSAEFSDSGYSKPITTTRSSSEIKSIEEIEKIYDKNPEKYKGTELEAAVAAYKDPDANGIYKYNGKTKNVLDGFVFDDINNKMYPNDNYEHGASGVDGAHFRQEESGKQPETAVKEKTRRKLSGVFGQMKDTGDLTPTLLRLGYSSKIGLFSEEPEDEYMPMRWTNFKIVRFGEGKDERGSDDEAFDDLGDGGQHSNKKIMDILPTNDGDGDIEGYYEIIKGISDCIFSKGARSCGTEISNTVKDHILNDQNLIIRAHDFIVELLINNISKKDFKTPSIRKKFTNSELGKILQKAIFEKDSRKNRKDLASRSEIDTPTYLFGKDSTEKEEAPNSNLNRPKKDLIENRFLETIFDFPGKENQANLLSKGNRDKIKEVLSGLLEDPEKGVAAKLNQYSGLFQELDGYEKISEKDRSNLLSKINKQKNQLLEYLSELVMGPTSLSVRRNIVLDYYQQMERKLNKIPKDIVVLSRPEEKVQTIEKEKTQEEKMNSVFLWIKETVLKMSRILPVVFGNPKILPISKNLTKTINDLNPHEKEVRVRESAVEIAKLVFEQTINIKSINFFLGKGDLETKINNFNFICDVLNKLESDLTIRSKNINLIKNSLKEVWTDLSIKNFELKGIKLPTPKFILI